MYNTYEYVALCVCCCVQQSTTRRTPMQAGVAYKTSVTLRYVVKNVYLAAAVVHRSCTSADINITRRARQQCESETSGLVLDAAELKKGFLKLPIYQLVHPTDWVAEQRGSKKPKAFNSAVLIVAARKIKPPTMKANFFWYRINDAAVPIAYLRICIRIPYVSLIRRAASRYRTLAVYLTLSESNFRLILRPHVCTAAYANIQSR